jgi:HD-GYP domain-containing protein (c-di-GMP phosphodiesterase class II)
MANIDLFAPILKENLKSGHILKYDVYLHLKENDSVIFFKNRGDVITEEELKNLNATPLTTVLVKKADIKKIVDDAGQTLLTALKSKKELDSKEVLSSAAVILRSLDFGKPAPGSKTSSTAAKRESLLQIHGIIQGMISQVGTQPLALCYDTVLKSIEGTHLSDLDLHNLQVSALSVLMYLTEGKGSADELANLALAGLMHDVGLNGVPSELLDRHLSQDEVFNSFEQAEYNQHIELSKDQVRKLYPKVADSVLKAIEFHHENFDGSGPKKIAGNRIPHLARVLRIADDVSIRIVKSKSRLEFREALAPLKGDQRVKYDHQIIQSIEDHFLAMGMNI